MNAVVAIAAAACAPSTDVVDWHGIDWSQAHAIVRRLQARIVKATKDGRWGKVHALQRLLTTSFSAKAMAVKRVTENSGKNTPGVDRVIWSSPAAKSEAVKTLRRHGYQPKPLKRIYIPKANGKSRPLSIPTMYDRAMQALYLLALDPVSEVVSDGNSYGFRKGRSTHDAMLACYNAARFGEGCKDERRSAEWVLEGDIKGCFDNISHDWLLTHVPMDKVMLRKWLSAGYMESGRFHGTSSGTPQGGIISPVLANFALNGLDAALTEAIGGSRKRRTAKVHLIRYADDFVISGLTPEILREIVQPAVERFLAVRGLELSKEKTKISNIYDGYDFLGQTVRRFERKLLIKPSKKNTLAMLRKVRGTIKSKGTVTQLSLISALNPIIRGWANYHRHQVSKRTFVWVDFQIWQSLWQWCRRRHPGKNPDWIKRRYFSRVRGRDWTFCCPTGGILKNGVPKHTYLCFAHETSIRRHVKIKGDANPYDPEWSEYFQKRLRMKVIRSRPDSRTLLHVWFRQDGICSNCKEPLLDDEEWQVHHIVERQDGGSNHRNNLALVHVNCHRQIHVQRKRSRLPVACHNVT